MSIEGAYDEANIFAKVLRGEAGAYKVFEDENVLAFMDLFPQARGHVLVVSKRSKARNILEIEADDLCAVMHGVQRVAKAVRAALRPDGLVITQFNGSAAGQTVFHLHVHIIPRWAGEPLGAHGAGKMAEGSVLEEISARIAAEIA